MSYDSHQKQNNIQGAIAYYTIVIQIEVARVFGNLKQSNNL